MRVVRPIGGTVCASSQPFFVVPKFGCPSRLLSSSLNFFRFHVTAVVVAMQDTPRAPLDLSERVEFLSQIFLFRGMSDETLRAIATVLKERTVQPGQVIVQQGDTNINIFFIRSGTCKVIKMVTDGIKPSTPRGWARLRETKAVTVAEMKRLQYFGELGVLLNTGHTASVVSGDGPEPVELYLLSKDDWKAQVPERTRTKMVNAMISHAQDSYSHTKALWRSSRLGLRDEFLGDMDDDEDEEEEEEVADEEKPLAPSAATEAKKPAKPQPLPVSELLSTHNLPILSPSIVQATAMGLLVPVLPLRAAELVNADGIIGAVVSGRGAGTIAGGPIAGMVIAAIGLRSGLVTAMGLACVAAIGGALVGDVWLLLSTRLIAGIGLAFFQVGRQTYVSQNLPPASRGTFSAFVAGTTRLGTTIGPAAGGGIVQLSNTTSSAFWLEASLFAVAGGMLQACMPFDGRVGGGAAPSGGGGGGGGGGGSKDAAAAKKAAYPGFPSAACALSPVLIALTFVRAARELLLPLIAADLGATPAEIGMLSSASFAVDTALVPVAGLTMDRYGRRYAGVPSLVLSAVGLVLLAVSKSTGMVLISALVLGLGNGMSNGWIQTVGADLAPEGFRPQFLGTWNLLMGIGTAVGPLACGAIAQWLSVGIGALFAAVVAVAGAGWYAVGAERETLPPVL